MATALNTVPRSWAGNLAPSVETAEVTITNAQIKALRATPKTLVAAPGDGRVLEFVAAVLLLDYGSNALTESSDNLSIRWAGGNVPVSEDIEATGFITATADTLTTARPKADPIAAAGNCENQALVLTNAGDGEYAGNSSNDTTMRVKIAYRTWPTGW